MRIGLALVVLASCGGSSNTIDAHLDGKLIDGHTPIDAKVWMDASTLDAGPRGPVAHQLPGVGNGVYWDNPSSTLYVTDETNDHLVAWTDAGGFQTFGTFPAGSAGIALGTVVRRADSTFLVPSFGFGTQGTIFTMASDGSSSASLTGLDVTRRRIALAQDPNGLLYDGFFVGGGTMIPTGGLASLVITTGVAMETTITTSTALKKVAGLLATTTTLYVCDQTASKIYAVVLATGATTTLASPPSCDQLSLLPDGDLVTGSLTGGVYRVTAAGVVSTIASGFEQVRGSAYDATLRRLFFVEHSVVPGGHDQLHIIPLDQ